MAYAFNGGTDRINYGSPSYLDTMSAMTMSAIVSISDYTTGSGFGRIMTKLQTFLVINNGSPRSRTVNAQVSYSTAGIIVTPSDNTLASSPTGYLHLLYRWDGGTTAGTNLEFFYNGTEPSYNTITNGSGSRVSDDADSFLLGNRAEGDRGMAGNISEAAVWNAALTAAEITSLSKGFKPHRIRPQSLVFYAPLIRTAAEVRNATAPTTTGTSVANHPRVY